MQQTRKQDAMEHVIVPRNVPIQPWIPCLWKKERFGGNKEGSVPETRKKSTWWMTKHGGAEA
jgi:hypothetical protein